jgi:hypothetical protein
VPVRCGVRMTMDATAVPVGRSRHPTSVASPVVLVSRCHVLGLTWPLQAMFAARSGPSKEKGRFPGLCLVERTGIEPVTFGLQSRRSPS